MSRWTFSQWADVTGGRLDGEDRSFDAVCTDSRALVPGSLFVAIPGPRFDGHDYARAALDAGAAGVLVASGRADGLSPAVVVPDTMKALADFARYWRDGLEGPVLAVTGSNGKTTVRSLLAAIMTQHWPDRVLATEGNYNNEIGLPLTLLRRRTEHHAVVLELGANHPGEIARLAAIARPQVGLITNAGPAHLEGFGDLDGVARAKGELIEALPVDGVAILNADDPRLPIWHELAGDRPRIEFGLKAGDVRPLSKPELGRDGCQLEVTTPVGEFELSLRLPGEHNLMNALAATAAALAANVPLETIRRGLASVGPEPGRLQVLPGPAGSTLVNDCYNANPGSLKAALDWLSRQPGRRWVLLGDMGELGEGAEAAHRDAGEWIQAAGVERLFTLGELAGLAGARFQGGSHFQTRAALIDTLAEELHEDVTLLIKGSRSMGLEQVVERLRETQDVMAGRGD
ncbi:UDP-N-acetylmuramoyl-tripeptide--D-alanyl-D-alanine ligase [Natronospira proteinivora]|uniref:UDP-N-acetylmuramoyl-tripeptide--D-alanyl-D-alanine ligase n=1 Tax=Natronospira proteinivora TaxID=1807133 RepID=A0ABT1G4T4_9GAMM|nr:UDP-N-acetylmuramoyl-tripeptide--D-alanyl-D-alanine ligase [Natronospira proteinivora]MCP1726102.1 UDP-N-acetylmuramoyl-tripeptide--D-alanyl-D-alanine ligase [Natronospira proteinivora]